jgi:hypothetical protein
MNLWGKGAVAIAWSASGGQPTCSGKVCHWNHFTGPKGSSGHESSKASVCRQDWGHYQIKHVALLIDKARHGVGHPDVINDPNSLVAPWVIKTGSRQVNERVM